MAVNDPSFWRRFSVAVHLDEAKTLSQGTDRPALKHTYVSSNPLYPDIKKPCVAVTESESPPTPTSPTIPPNLGRFSLSAQPFSTSQQQPQPQPPPPSSFPSTPEKQQPTRLTKTKHPHHHHRPLYSRRNTSNLTLGLSGRPASRGFKFWTQIEADPSHRESWLEGQRRKKRKRTCMCWGFWFVFLVVVAGIVVAVLVLKGKGII
ncbi:hypothetical protein M011DRAFT_476534 [Sporormia fimetaria CBS 119925]|uniref:Uncharacterized protein n=1 Tax=Sporormia fimetaria CBS 119925 TaxID=1340428 RepID=A0A6A6VFF6_9PLEO|nr:hypothetical protein M011DRAFT_476534 [Sporormia fimetaria CBS 119925]